jgi:hypothetical protein
MCDMSQAAAPTAVRRIVLVPARRSSGAQGREQLRRYRLARVALDGREATRAERFSHLKRSYD